MYKNRVENDRKIDTSSFYLGNSAKQSEEIQNHRLFLFSSAGLPWSQEYKMIEQEFQYKFTVIFLPYFYTCTLIIFNFLFWNLLNLKIASYYVRPIKVKLRFRGSPYVLNVFSVTTICKTKSKYAESSQPNHLHVVLLRQLTIPFPIQCNLDWLAK